MVTPVSDLNLQFDLITEGVTPPSLFAAHWNNAADALQAASPDGRAWTSDIGDLAMEALPGEDERREAQEELYVAYALLAEARAAFGPLLDTVRETLMRGLPVDPRVYDRFVAVADSLMGDDS